jgi:hypothetical protein
MEDQILHALDRLEAFGDAEPRVDGQENPPPPGQEIVDRHPPEGSGAVEVKEGAPRAALEELDAAPADGESPLRARRR